MVFTEPNIEKIQLNLDIWIAEYNNKRTHQSKMCCGRTPMNTLEDGKNLWKEKFVA